MLWKAFCGRCRCQVGKFPARNVPTWISRQSGGRHEGAVDSAAAVSAVPLKAVGTRAHERVDRRSRDGTSAKREGPEKALPKHFSGACHSMFRSLDRLGASFTIGVNPKPRALKSLHDLLAPLTPVCSADSPFQGHAAACSAAVGRRLLLAQKSRPRAVR